MSELAAPAVTTPAQGKTTSEHRMTQIAVIVGAICAVLPAVLEAFTQAQIEGKGWIAAIAAAVVAAAAAYGAMRTKVKIAHVEAEGRAHAHLATLDAAHKAAALERLAAGDKPLPDADVAA